MTLLGHECRRRFCRNQEIAGYVLYCALLDHNLQTLDRPYLYALHEGSQLHILRGA